VSRARSTSRRRERTRIAPAITIPIAIASLAFLPLLARSSPNVELVYVAPATCPPRSQIEAEIAAYLATSKASSAMSATIRIDAIATGVRVDIQTIVGAAKGHRVLVASTCEEGAHAASLIVALAVDPLVATAPLPLVSASASASASVPAPVSASVSISVSVPVPASASVPVPASASASVPPIGSPSTTTSSGESGGEAPPFGLTAAVGPGLDTAALPGVALGVAAQVGIDRDRLRLAATFLGLPSTRAGLDGRDAGGTFSLLAFGLATCVRVLGPLAPCAGFELGRMTASGFGVRNPASQHVLWKAAAVGVTAPLRYGIVGVRPEAWIVFPIAMPDFVLGDLGRVHTPGVGVRAALSFELAIL
jgi:hypothetical protein